MSPAAAALIAALVAGAVSGAAAALVAWAGPLDKPRARGAHDIPTVTSGGLAAIAGASLGLVLYPRFSDDLRGLLPAAIAMAFAAGLGLVGALDDMRDLGAKRKLGLQILLGLAFAAWVARIDVLPLAPGVALPLGAALAVAGTALWLVVATNAVNFMDGANGLAAGSLAIALAALGAAGLIEDLPGVAAAAFAGTGALVGFLPWNMARRLFQGDAGSLFSGLLAAGLAVVATSQSGGAISVYFAPFALLPFLTDVLLTLLIRARRGERLFEAHRDHLYQLWLRKTGGSHLALALRVWAIVLAFSLAALASQAAPEGMRPLLFAAGVLVCSVGWVMARRRLERA